MFFFEVALGQFSNLGSFRVFSICPLFEGISASMAVYCAVVGIFYNFINVYNMVYLFASLNKMLPYSICKNNTECNEKDPNQSKTPEAIYFRDHIVRNAPEEKYSGFIDYVNWRNIGLLLYLWITFTVAIFKGVEKMKRLPFVYVPICYTVFLLVLLVTLCLKGAADGIAFMFIPDWETFKNLKTWIFALEQTMLTLGLGLGPVITLASYCDFASPAHKDSLLISLSAIVGSLLIGGILFSVMGILAAERKVPINKVIGQFKPNYSGFVVQVIYSQLFSRLPNGVGQLMNFLFYATFVMSGWLSLVMYFETTIFTIFIQLPMSRISKMKVNIAVFVVCFILGMFLANKVGDEIIWNMEMHLADFGLFLIIILEFVAVIYLYGVFKFCDNIELMLEVHTHAYYKDFVLLQNQLWFSVSDAVKDKNCYNRNWCCGHFTHHRDSYKKFGAIQEKGEITKNTFT
ncbi:sodium-dependent proline transporter-like isoform X2 [Agrilus planipennis]|uniref:Sodium-dependent proline transporter-like isoform X2 n=1 Tax=Agrilus planipennis TaxID=224129 RepID=A0A7F5RDD9_AGRPL|nr:sodium-dependent proline transporter-like isoform X2 [Agrilus planipennis]